MSALRADRSPVAHAGLCAPADLPLFVASDNPACRGWAQDPINVCRACLHHEAPDYDILMQLRVTRTLLALARWRCVCLLAGSLFQAMLRDALGNAVHAWDLGRRIAWRSGGNRRVDGRSVWGIPGDMVRRAWRVRSPC